MKKHIAAWWLAADEATREEIACAIHVIDPMTLIDACRMGLDEANRWTAVEDELRSMLNGVSGANLICRQRIALITAQEYTIGSQLACDPANAVLYEEAALRLTGVRELSGTPAGCLPF